MQQKLKLKTAKQIERHMKGVANHYRIKILLLICEEEGITVEAITERLEANFKTISQHTRYLLQAGLIEKKHKGRTVSHMLSPYGRLFAGFIKKFQHINAP